MKWLVQYGAYIDMTIPSGPRVFLRLLETRQGAAILKKIINENAIKYDASCYHHKLPTQHHFVQKDIDSDMIRLCNDAGITFWNIPKLEISGMPDHIQDLIITMQGVSSLKSLCRITIRRNIGSPLLRFIGSLGLPELINDYLMFTNECVVSRGQLEEVFGDVDCLDDEDL